MINRIGVIGIGVLMLLAIPFIAMHITDQVSWTLSDFILMGSILFTVGLGVDFMVRSHYKPGVKVVLILGMIAIFFLIWAELAVGLFGTPFAGS